MAGDYYGSDVFGDGQIVDYDDNSTGGTDILSVLGGVLATAKEGLNGWYEVKNLDTSLKLERERIKLMSLQAGATGSTTQTINDLSAGSVNYQQWGFIVAALGLALAVFVTFLRK